ncbi:LacI family DNA-binding transcriptional regulator [Curvibacter sp. CHRR-16]|uniref:LacI family DNA-binding transcriptional regulator n=1 Tax=Curvibacter sp. CHRR-16 TaxID=2835872 RepID=UPI001BDB4E4E|nr:LacI family DNA-binding transcriptional regulator [Curvibacter sp. CHRR-16]MBT0570881.1 LacI family DNA-binding transcriptional regulator [Curvibacter sp. CHRR-16]
MVTIAQIAEQTGVSVATVSNVMRDRGKVGKETRERILALAKELGYRPNLNARALVQGRAQTIALVASSIANPFYPEFAQAVETAVRKLGYFLIVCNTNDDPEQEKAYLDAVSGSLAHGILVMNADFVQIDALLDMHNRGIPVVLCMWERPQEPPALPCVAVDFYQAGACAAEHLLKLGHKQIGAIVGSLPTGNHIWRYRGFKETLEKAGLQVDEARQVRFGHDSIDAGRNAAHGLLAGNPALTAIFATNDLPAVGVLQAAADLGLQVPYELSVVGVTDIQLAHQMRPALTTVAVPTQEAADMAVAILMEEIQQAQGQPAMRITAAPQLVVRGSTTRARASQ